MGFLIEFESSETAFSPSSNKGERKIFNHVCNVLDPLVTAKDGQINLLINRERTSLQMPGVT